MADLKAERNPGAIPVLMQDMGDGTYAERVALASDPSIAIGIVHVR